MQKTSIIAKNYAKALFKASKASNNIDKIQEDLSLFGRNFTSEFASELANPAISKKDLIKIISEICNKIGLKGVAADFLTIVAQNKRIGHFDAINAEFTNLVKIDKNILEVEIISASELANEEVSKLEQLISKQNEGKKIEFTKTIKDNILGGVQVKIGSNLIDASLQNQLKSLENKLVEAIN